MSKMVFEHGGLGLGEGGDMYGKLEVKELSSMWGRYFY